MKDWRWISIQRGPIMFGGDATQMFCMMDEAQEGRGASLEKCAPDLRKFP